MTAMKARELGRKGVVVGDRVALVGDLAGADGHAGPDRPGRAARRSVLRRTADDTDPVERVIVANADQLAIVTALADPEPRPRLIDRCLVAAYDAGLRPAAGADQGRPGAAGRAAGARTAPSTSRTSSPAPGRATSAPLRQSGCRARDTVLRRPLRRRQVDPGQRAGARCGPRDRARQRGHRPRPAHSTSAVRLALPDAAAG